jgi:hypothetical protein
VVSSVLRAAKRRNLGTYEGLGNGMFDVRLDARRHSRWGITAPCVAQAHHLSKDSQDVARLGVGLIATNSRDGARPTYRRRKEFIRHAKYPDHAAHRRCDPVG